MRLANKRVIALVDHDFEDLELWYPILRLQEEGATVHLIGPHAKETYFGKYGVPAVSDFGFKDLQAAAGNYDGILVPGGWAPDSLRRHSNVLQYIQEMDKAEKIIGQICHGGWVLISADILKGKTVTSTPGIKDDMTNAGATWVDEPVVVDGHLISSRKPDDLPHYMKTFADKLAE